MSAHFFQPPHAHLIDMLGQAVRCTYNPDINGTLVKVEGDWATIAAPPDALGLRRKDEVRCEFIEVAKGGEVLAAMWAEQEAKAPACSVCGTCTPVAAYGGWCCALALAEAASEAR